MLVVPIVVHHEVVAALVFHHRRQAVRFTTPDLVFADRLMVLSTLALENARLYEREHRIADVLQAAVLSPLESAPGVESSVLYRPASSSANIGGDFYDLFRIDEQRVGIVVGDVSGKGIEAARLTSLLHDGIRAYAYEGRDAAQVLGSVNRLVHRATPPEMFATLFFGVLEPETGKLSYCVAGHPPPIVVAPEAARFLGGEQSPLLGSFPDVEYALCDAKLATGEMLVLYTDGITEARAGAGMLGEERLLKMLTKMRHSSAQRLPERLLAGVLKFAEGRLSDDTVVLCVKRTQSDADDDRS
jgi:serine phosphatase RsbU (regulator of sigma subunit)